MGKKKKKKKLVYIHSKKGDLMKVEVRDETYRIIYRNKFNIKDQNAVYAFLKVLEQFSGLSIREVIREKSKSKDWW